MDAWLSFALSLAVKVTLVLGAALVVTRLMRRRAAAERHLVWVIAAACVLAVPLFAVLTPVPVRAPAWIAPTPPAQPVVTPTPGPTLHEIAPLPVEATATVIPTPAPPAPPQPPIPPRDSGMPLPVALLIVWGVVASVLAVRLVGEFARVHAITRRARACADAALLVRAHGVAASLGIARTVRVLEGDEDVMPMTFGILHPTLLLPSAARSWSDARLYSVLRHELAHIRRYDALTQLVAEIGCVLYWFHPLMWQAARSLRVEREHACDDAVIIGGARASDYAAELLDIARVTQPPRVTELAAIAMARPKQLRERLAALLDERARRERLSPRLFVPAWIGTLLVVIPVATLTPVAGHIDDSLPFVREFANYALENLELPRAQKTADRKALVVAEGISTSSVQPAVVRVAPAIQEPCLAGRLNNVNSNSNDERRTIKWSGNGCNGELVIVGDVRFDADFTRIVGLDSNGSLTLTTREGNTERRLIMRPAATGVGYEYSVNGDRREFDAEGRRWLDTHMLFMFRRMGLMAQERAAAILARGGADALLAEVGMLGGDYVRATYLEVLVARGQLSEDALRRVLTLAGNTIDSDHYRTQILTAVAGRYQFTDGIRTAYIDAASAMDSDHYRHAAFSALLRKGQLSPQQVSAVLRESRRIGSDHYRATLLSEMQSTYRSNPDVRPAFLDAAAAMDSDHYKTMVLGGLLGLGGMTPTDLARVVDAAATIDSDHYRAQVMSSVAANNGLSEPALQRAFVRAAAGIDSDHYLVSVLSPVVQRPNIDAATLGIALEAAGSIEGDHYLTQLLLQIASRQQLTGANREQFIKLMDTLQSQHYRGQVADVLLRQSR
jgi:beta-lactamase regulating signal transducer with metallopeptidase domain